VRDHHTTLGLSSDPDDRRTRRRNAAAIMIALSVGSLALTLLQVIGLVGVDYTGRFGWLKSWAYQVLGPYGPSVITGLLGIVLLVVGIQGRKSN